MPRVHAQRASCFPLRLATVALLCSADPLAAQVPEIYDSAVVEATGLLRIVTMDHRQIQPPRDTDQVGFDEAAVSPNRLAVGWLALFPNCCTSYPIPLKLVIYSDGTVHTFTGAGLPIWRWQFDSTSTRVAFYQETVHGGMGAHYELRDIVTEALVMQYEPVASEPPPAWAAPLIRP